MDEEGHRAEETITAFDPPRRLAFTWGGSSEGASEVVFELAPGDGGKVLLTLTHRKLPNETERTGTAGGWHCHLTILVEKLEGRTPPAFWDVFRKIDAEYADGIPRD
jgi:uncharacterized protein YndB with AHSA1/START domain